MEAWLAALRAAGVPTTQKIVDRWYGVDAELVAESLRLGYSDPLLAARWVPSGATAKEATALETLLGEVELTLDRRRQAVRLYRLGATDRELKRHIESHLLPDDLEDWVTEFRSLTKAIEWRTTQLKPTVAARWARAGFDPGEARRWSKQGVSLAGAKAARAAGLKASLRPQKGR